MINKILLASLIILMVILGLLSVSEYDKRKLQQQEINQTAITQLENEKSLLQAEINQLKADQAELTDIQKDCEIGLEAYNLLTDLEKANIDEPKCALEIIE